MKIRLKMDMLGTFHGIENAKKGDVVDVDEPNGLRYCSMGYAEPVTKSGERKVEKRVMEEGENATLEGVELTAAGGPVEDPPHGVNADALDMEATIGAPGDVTDDGVAHDKPKVLDEDEDSGDSDDSTEKPIRPRSGRAQKRR